MELQTGRRESKQIAKHLLSRSHWLGNLSAHGWMGVIPSHPNSKCRSEPGGTQTRRSEDQLVAELVFSLRVSLPELGQWHDLVSMSQRGLAEPLYLLECSGL